MTFALIIVRRFYALPPFPPPDDDADGDGPSLSRDSTRVLLSLFGFRAGEIIRRGELRLNLQEEMRRTAAL